MDKSDQKKLRSHLSNGTDKELCAMLENLDKVFEGYQDRLDPSDLKKNHQILEDWSIQYNIVEEILIERGIL